VKVTRRGKFGIAAGAIVLVSGFGVALALAGRAPAPIQKVFDAATGANHTPPPTCPLTGENAPGGTIPNRPALAIKVENLPEARPQTGLDHADIVYEEPVEGGITRFIAIYQCKDPGRVGPVRSGRVEDAEILRQFGRPVFGFAGGAGATMHAIAHSTVIDENYLVATKQYTRDPSRAAPHNLYTTTGGLWKAAKGAIAKVHSGVPHPVFTYGGSIPRGSRRIGQVHLPFSSYSDVYWRWNAGKHAWLRWHGTVRHTLTDGQQVQATNVVVMSVDVKESSHMDPAGNPIPSVAVMGSGKAWVFRAGRMIVGHWSRRRPAAVTSIVAKNGSPISLDPGTTWVELLPSTIAPKVSRS